MRHVRVLLCLLVVGLLWGLVVSPAPAVAAATPCVDIKITSISTVPTRPVKNRPATINIGIQNAGSCDARGFVVQWKSDIFAPTGPSESVDFLAAGAFRTVSFVYSFPNEGNQLTIVEADTGNAVSETNEVNNLEIHSLTVDPARIDLRVLDVDFSPDPAVSGRVTTVSLTVFNGGNTPSGSFRVQWTPFIFGVPLSRLVSSLDPGESRQVNFSFTYPFPGTFQTSAVVDSAGQVAEVNEFNNTLDQQLVVEPPLPNLRVSDVDISPSDPIATHTTTVDVTVVNDGHADAGSFRVQWQPWFLEQPLVEQVDALDEGDSTVVRFEYVFPIAGNFDGTILVDSQQSVFETKENDNSTPTDIDVQEATKDLVITELVAVDDGNGEEGCPPFCDPRAAGDVGAQVDGVGTQGQPTTFCVIVTNQGNTAAGPFIVEVNPDTFHIITPSLQTVSNQINELGPGESEVMFFTFTYPKAGNFRVVAHADAFNTIAESNEKNNLKILNMTIAPAALDLVITGFTFNPAQPVRAVPATVDVTVRNDGPIDSPDFFVGWKPKANENFQQTQFAQGLNPGESRTVSFEGTYFDAGTFQTQAQVDVFNNVVEPFGENNNTSTRSVTVVPQSARVRATLVRLQVFNDLDNGGLPGNTGEWNPVIFAILQPGASCTITVSLPIIGEIFKGTVKDVNCLGHNAGDVTAPTSVPINRSFELTLQEGFPLVAGVTAIEDDSPAGPNFPGYTLYALFRPDYLRITSPLKAEGQQCEQSGGHCFDSFLSVTPLDVVGPSAALTSAAERLSSPISTSATAKAVITQNTKLKTALSKIRARLREASTKVKSLPKAKAAQAKVVAK